MSAQIFTLDRYRSAGKAGCEVPPLPCVPQQPPPQAFPAIPLVRTNQLEIVDNKGKSRISLSAISGHTLFMLRDDRGKDRLMLSVSNSDPDNPDSRGGVQIILFNASERKQVRLRFDAKGRLYDEGNTALTEVRRNPPTRRHTRKAAAPGQGAPAPASEAGGDPRGPAE